MKIRHAFFVLLLGWSCSGSDQARLMSENAPQIVGHAGMGFRSLVNPFNPLPDNSFASVIKALEVGAEGIEVDVQITKDSVLVLYHDIKLESKTNGEGCIAETMAENVVGLKYKMGFPYDFFQNEEIIKLEKLLEELKKETAFPALYLDIHSYNYCEKGIKVYGNISSFGRALAKLEQKYDVSKEIIYTSTYELLLLEIRKTGAKGRLYFEEDFTFERGMKIIEKYGFDGLVIKKSLINAKQVKSAKEKSISVVIFGGKSKSTLRDIALMGPDAMQVNNIKTLKELLY